MIAPDSSADIEHRIRSWHHALQSEYRSLRRIAVAIYDEDSDALSTFLYSSTEVSPLVQYEVKLSAVPSLVEIAKSGKPRVVSDLSVFSASRSVHSRKIYEAGLRSSYTMAIYENSKLFGFLFYNSTEEEFFNEAVLAKLHLYSELISLVVREEMRPVRTLRSAVNTARVFTEQRDCETGEHLERMSCLTRQIARKMSPKFGLSDKYVQLLFQLAGMHDLGKIAVPDAILLKKGRLTKEEFGIMKSHVPKGIEMVNMLIEQFSLEAVEYAPMLRNVVGYHHENYDGTGYPFGLAGTDIPLEARIARVADVYDALTSERPYKKAWTAEAAMTELEAQKGIQFDPDCVDALAEALAEEIAEVLAEEAAEAAGEPYLQNAFA